MNRRDSRRPLSGKDALDLDALEALKTSRGWSLFEGRVRKMIADKTADLVRDHDERQTAALRGSITSLTSVLEIPAILANEARQDIRSTKTRED